MHYSVPTFFFTSDNHFNHTNIIKYCGRPFANVDTMNEAMIANWNNRVAPSDIVYHLGDFAMGKRELIKSIRDRLNGHIILILGNHDQKASYMRRQGFNEVHEELRIEVSGRGIYLRHIPNTYFDHVRNDYHLCGHVHEAWARKNNIINVGVDVRGFTPVRLNELI